MGFTGGTRTVIRLQEILPAAVEFPPTNIRRQRRSQMPKPTRTTADEKCSAKAKVGSGCVIANTMRASPIGISEATNRCVPIKRALRACQPLTQSRPPTTTSRIPAARPNKRAFDPVIITPYICDANCGAAVAITPVIMIATPNATRIASAIEVFEGVLIDLFSEPPNRLA